MSKYKQYTSTTTKENSADSISSTPVGDKTSDKEKKQFKKELMEVFQKFGYLEGGADHEVKFRTTSGNVAWININRIETIK